MLTDSMPAANWLKSGMNYFFPDASKQGMPYYQEAQSQLPQWFLPWIQGGQSAMGQLSPLLQQMTSNPGGFINQIGSSYKQSPGFQFALNQALKASNQTSNAGGMAGSPMTQQQNMGMATNLANQDYYNYLDKANSMFGQGLQGLENLTNMGANASSSLGENIASLLASQGNLAYTGQANQNQMLGGLLGDLFGFGGSIAKAGAFGGG